jgi:hypothetical protein
MLALLLAAQITAAAAPQGLPLDVIPPPRGYVIPPPRGYIMPLPGLIRGLPAKTCAGAGRMEASFGKPTALYRSGDRPAKPLARWADYPDPYICAVEAAP